VTMKKDSGAAVLSTIIAALEGLPSEEQQKLVDTVRTYFGLRADSHVPVSARALTASIPTPHSPGGGFSEKREMSPKEFLFQKQPRKDVERVACLAFYLTHYRNTPHFKTIDISKLNTEAAQTKMSNAAAAVDNATRTGYLVPAAKGAKQISAAGEVFVQALPDREAARSAITQARPKKRHRKSARPGKTRK
jgi:hypothetical protein